MTKSHDTLAYRLVHILTKLNNGESFTAKELAEKLDSVLKEYLVDTN